MVAHEDGESRSIRRVEVTEIIEDQVIVVALSEEQDGTGRVLLFQRALAFDEQDVAMGMDTYCLSDEEGTAVYGGVTSCILAQDVLTLRLAPEAAATLAMGSPCRLHLHVDPSAIGQLREGLRRVLMGGHSAPDTLLL